MNDKQGYLIPSTVSHLQLRVPQKYVNIRQGCNDLLNDSPHILYVR